MSHPVLSPSLMAGLVSLCLLTTATTLRAQTSQTTDFLLSAAPPATGDRDASERAQPLTLTELIQTVVAHNTELRAAEQARVGALAGVRTASAYANPRVEWQTGRNQARMPGTAAGGARIWLAPDIPVTYFPRRTPRALACSATRCSTGTSACTLRCSA